MSEFATSLSKEHNQSISESFVDKKDDYISHRTYIIGLLDKVDRVESCLPGLGEIVLVFPLLEVQLCRLRVGFRIKAVWHGMLQVVLSIQRIHILSVASYGTLTLTNAYSGTGILCST